MKKISAVYKIVNEVTGDFYVGSSKDVKARWAHHKIPSRWKEHPNNPMYRDMQKYGVDKFRFQILTPVMEEYLKQVEQEFIDMLHPTYNNYRAKGIDVERIKETRKEYQKYYNQSDKGKEASRKGHRIYKHKLCSYNGETLTLDALVHRFSRTKVEHPFAEARKYLIKEENH